MSYLVIYQGSYPFGDLLDCKGSDKCCDIEYQWSSCYTSLQKRGAFYPQSIVAEARHDNIDLAQPKGVSKVDG